MKGLIGFGVFLLSFRVFAVEDPVARSYQKWVLRSYAQLLEKNQALDEAARILSKTPTDENLNKARAAWKEARLAYSPTEAFRFYGGPIDAAEKGPEPLMNAWPIDESYLDAVKDKPQGGLIVDQKAMPVITTEALIAANEKGGERNVSTGYHAVEFLLWGQDFSTTGPGARTADDFRSTSLSGDRRGQALMALTGLLVKHTEDLIQAWGDDAPYVNDFVMQKPEEVKRRILVGLTSLSADEMAGERMTVALEKNDPEHEQDCFSDFSLEDLKANQAGIENTLKESGLLALMQKENKSLAKKIEKAFAKTRKSLAAIPAPFDVLIANPKNKNRRKVQKAIDNLNNQASALDQFAKRWNVELNVQSHNH